MKYTGTGSELIEIGCSHLITELSMHLSQQGFELLTGDRIGTESAFRTGAKHKTVFTVHFNPNVNEYTVTSGKSLMFAEKMLNKFIENDRIGFVVPNPVMLRNLAMECHIVLGKDLSSPSSFMLLYRDPNELKSISELIAEDLDIPIFNIANSETQKVMIDMLKKGGDIHDIIYSYNIKRKAV